MSEKIEPALDAEDWGVELADGDDFSGVIEQAGTFSGAVITRGGKIGVVIYGGAAAQLIADDERHRLAALALYGQPFGFTREHMRLLRAAATTCRNDDHYIAGALELGEWYDTREEELAAKYDSFADLIEALLPPEK